MGGIGQNLQLQSDFFYVLKLYVLLGHHTKLTHTKFGDKICHILRVMGKNECARHYKSGFSAKSTCITTSRLMAHGVKCDLFALITDT